MDDSPFRRLVMISAISATDRKLLNINFQEKNILCLTFSFFDNIFLWLNVKRLLYYNYDCKSTNFALMKCKNKIFFFSPLPKKNCAIHWNLNLEKSLAPWSAASSLKMEVKFSLSIKFCFCESIFEAQEAV